MSLNAAVIPADDVGLPRRIDRSILRAVLMTVPVPRSTRSVATVVVSKSTANPKRRDDVFPPLNAPSLSPAPRTAVTGESDSRASERTPAVKQGFGDNAKSGKAEPGLQSAGGTRRIWKIRPDGPDGDFDQWIERNFPPPPRVRILGPGDQGLFRNADDQVSLTQPAGQGGVPGLWRFSPGPGPVRLSPGTSPERISTSIVADSTAPAIEVERDAIADKDVAEKLADIGRASGGPREKARRLAASQASPALGPPVPTAAAAVPFQRK